MHILDRTTKEIIEYFQGIRPGEPIITKMEYEGAKIAIYVSSPEVFAEQDQIAKELVNLIKKRIVIRSDPNIRAERKQAEATINKYLEDRYNIIFDEALGEAIVETKNPTSLLQSKGHEIKKIMMETGWIVKIVREPLIPSKSMDKVKNYIYWDPKQRIEALKRIGEIVFKSQAFETTDLSVTFLGAGKQVGRSAILVETTESRVLLDCGLAPGANNNMNMFPKFDAKLDEIMDLDAIVVSHAHMDHAGMVPYLFKYGYRGPVYCTEPTVVLMTMELLDYINLMGKEGVFAPYTEHEIRLAMQHTVPIKYGLVTNITPDVRLTFYNAGHILGSAVVHLHIGEGFHNIIYTGDFKFERTRMFDPSVYKFPRAETLIMESTYGNTPVPFTREESESLLASHISNTIDRGGKVIIPVPAVGRAQEIMLVLNHLFSTNGIPEVPVFLDGLLVEATAIHTAYPEYLSNELRTNIEEAGNIFMSEYFTPVRNQSQREEILSSKGPAIIISTSGMLEGGPVLTYLKEFGGDENNLMLFVSYQVEGTRGRRILKGMREVEMVNEEGKREIVKINMKVEKVDGFSGHSSRQQLINYIGKFTPKPKNLIFIHGEPEAVESLATSASRLVNSRIYVPKNLDTIALA